MKHPERSPFSQPGPIDSGVLAQVEKLSGKKDSDITTYPAGTQGAGMQLTITVLPTTVSFQALEVMEGTCNASAVQRLLQKSHSASP